MSIFDDFDSIFDCYKDYMFDMFGEVVEPEAFERDDYDDQLLMADMESYIEWDE